MKKYFLASIAIFISSQAFASLHLDVDSELGQGFFSSYLNLSKSFTTEANEFSLSQLNAGGGFNQSKTEDSSTGTVTVTKGRSGSLGGGIAYDQKWKLDLSLYANSTPETNYGESGGNMQISYHSKNSGETDWNYALGVSSGRSRVVQRINFQILNTTVNRDAELDKNETGVFASLSPAQWLSARIDYQKYGYSRSKQDLQAIYASRFLNYYTSDLISSIGGLPEYAASLSVTASVSEDWDVSFLTRRTHLIVDDSDSKKSQISADRYFDRFSLGAGVSRSETNQGLDNSVLLHLGIDL
jgi:hypothetical protein